MPSLPKMRALSGFLLTAGLFVSVSPSAAAPAQDAPHLSLFGRIAESTRPSTISYGPGTVHLPGSSLAPDSMALSFEARVIPRFTVLRAVEETGPLAGSWWLTVDAEFMVRRHANLPSNPVRTPGYRPGATLHYAPPGASPESFWHVSGTWFHWSNGQEGELFVEGPLGPELNTVNGSFSLWGAGAALHAHPSGRFMPAHLALRGEAYFFREGWLADVYPHMAVTLEAFGKGRHSGWAGFSGDTRWWSELTWRPSQGGVLAEHYGPAPFGFMTMAAYRPDWRPAFLPFRVHTGSFFAFTRLYLGPDEYNVRFGEPVHRIDFGFLAGPGVR